MTIEESATRLVVFLSEDDHAGHQHVHQALLERAREEGMAGATVWRGIEGFGASGHLRTTRFPDAVTGLPLAVELIDQSDRIEAFLPIVLELAPRSLVTKEQVHMRRPGSSGSAALDDPAPRRMPRPWDRG